MNKDYFVEAFDDKIDVIMKKIDINLSGKIDYTEFIVACLDH